ncbi:MAG: GNAT family N-acetyltransferase [Ruminococcus sp.]|nr:GNAT family N-acetyltransferase [Ruminococcus sp.]MDE6849671.1 GNAT family N-acetyltransferase [Ruminococcus sp.]MDE7139079.1 GNAT family N-acetyltransferase [Ruminococcus sp.]
MNLRKAVQTDINVVADIYKSVIGFNYSLWTEDYPTIQNVMQDFRNGNLYVFEDNNIIIGACSVESESVFENNDFWKINDGTQCEISRIVIAPEYQGNGYARIMVGNLIDILSENGFESVHLFVVKSNIPAVETYRNLGFDFSGECSMFEHEYFAMEYIVNRKEV